MKKFFSLFITTALCVSLMSCGSENTVNDTVVTEIGNESEISADEAKETSDKGQTGNSITDADMSSDDETLTGTENNILVVYFSVTGNTKTIAEGIADGLPADIYEIVPKEAYTDVDLNYNDDNSRSTQEMNDASARPEISGTIDHFDQYDTIFLGYPIWWGEAPRIMDTFVESYDFTGKTVIPFCTSGSSGIGSSANTLESLAGSGNWVDGQRFSANESADNVLTWARQYE